MTTDTSRSAEFAAAVAYLRRKLANLDRFIARSAQQHREQKLIPERKHLVVLLRTLGVDVEDLPEGSTGA